MKCVNSFERPESRENDLYGLAYAARHEIIRHPDAITFVFDEPVEVHPWDGWVPFANGWSNELDRAAPPLEAKAVTVSAMNDRTCRGRRSSRRILPGRA